MLFQTLRQTFLRGLVPTSQSAQKMVTKARTKTQEQTLEKLTHIVAGRRRFISDPPRLVPLEELLSQDTRY